MGMDKLAVVILNLAAISALLYLFDYPYRRYRERALRDQLFCIRDRLFVAAEQGVLSFNDPAYGNTRRILNGMIRFAHNFTLWRTFLLVVADRLAPALLKNNEIDEYVERYSKCVDKLPAAAKDVIHQALAEAHIAVLSHMLHTSLFTFPGTIALKHAVRWVFRLRSFYTTLVESRFMRPTNALLDREAYLVGC
jgi:hypothetical protein